MTLDFLAIVLPIGPPTLPAAGLLAHPSNPTALSRKYFFSHSLVALAFLTHLFLFLFYFVPDTLVREVDQGGPKGLAWVGCYRLRTRLSLELLPNSWPLEPGDAADWQSAEADCVVTCWSPP